MSWLFYRWFAAFGISLFVFKDSQSLFLRHIQSGKCIKAGDLVYKPANDYSLPYWAIMTENCLDVNAQFRYLDSELLHNIGKDGTFFATTASVFKGRLAVYKGLQPGGINTQNSPTNRLKQRATGTLYFYNKQEKRCAETSPTDNNVKGVKSCGGNPEQNFTFGAVTEYNARMENVSCSKIQHMMIQTADYGDYDNSGTFNNNAAIDTQCSELTNCQVKSLCGGIRNRSCELTMDNNLLPSQYCSDPSKQIYTKYTCVDTYSFSAITTAPKIRLTNRNTAFIEVKNGSIWRKVIEENWDENRQKMLCQHLGFEEINDNRIETRKLASGQQIATGDLICYNTQPSGTSCCVHLEPSTSTTSTTIPYVRCKICNEPQLHNSGAFPDSVFSGSGDPSNKYTNARITRGGWCPSGSGSVYLLLDLQKEYHIKQVVVMADKAQTKWSGSYFLKYSHNTSYNNTAKISGNQNGYQASKTNLDIYNVRYMKIESIGNQEFCLRIEVCGEVQTPAPVYNINVSSSQYSANVTWQIPTSNQNSSYITKIIVYLNGQEHTTISRGTRVTINRLLPYTSYTVELQTQDGSLQKSNKVTKTFWTNKEEPINPLTTSYYTLSLDIPKQKDCIRDVMVIVENSIRSSARSENLRTSDLKPYQRNIKGPYVTAYVKADVLPLTFVIGDGREYNSEDEKYFNQPLKHNSKYIVFLRFFENQNSYYSTEWSGNVTTMMKPPVESENSKQSNGEEIRIDLIIPLVIFVACFVLSLGVIIYQRRKKCHKCEASKQEQQIKKFNSRSNNKRTKNIKAPPEDRSNVTNDEGVYELPDSECTKQNQAKPEISTGQESSTYMYLKDNKEPENVYQSLQPQKDNIVAVEYENPAFTSINKF